MASNEWLDYNGEPPVRYERALAAFDADRAGAGVTTPELAGVVTADELEPDATERLADEHAKAIADRRRYGGAAFCYRCMATITPPGARLDLNPGGLRSHHWQLCDDCAMYLVDWLDGNTPDFVPAAPPPPNPVPRSRHQ